MIGLGLRFKTVTYGFRTSGSFQHHSSMFESKQIEGLMQKSEISWLIRDVRVLSYHHIDLVTKKRSRSSADVL